MLMSLNWDVVLNFLILAKKKKLPYPTIYFKRFFKQMIMQSGWTTSIREGFRPVSLSPVVEGCELGDVAAAAVVLMVK